MISSFILGQLFVLIFVTLSANHSRLADLWTNKKFLVWWSGVAWCEPQPISSVSFGWIWSWARAEPDKTGVSIGGFKSQTWKLIDNCWQLLEKKIIWGGNVNQWMHPMIDITTSNDFFLFFTEIWHTINKNYGWLHQ